VPSGNGNADNIRDQIAAEIEDHLGLAAQAHTRRGTSVDEAREMAAAAFGDVEAIKRSCWWVQQGDQVMFRAVTVSLLAIICVGLAAVAFGGWRLSSRLEDLTAALDHLKDPGDASAARNTPEITGFCYLKDRKRPAAGAQLELRQLPDMKVLRRLQADAQGRFRSGPVAPGDYCLLAPLIGPRNPEVNDAPLYWLQTQPVYVGEGANPDPVLDVHFAHGHALVELKTKLPSAIEVNGKIHGIQVWINVEDDLVKLPWDPSKPFPVKWPVVGPREEVSFSTQLQPEKFGVPVLLSGFGSAMPVGRYRITAAIYGPQHTFGGSMVFSGDVGPEKFVTELVVADGERVLLEVRFSDDAIERLRKASEDAAKYAVIFGEIRIATRNKNAEAPQTAAGSYFSAADEVAGRRPG